MPELGKPNPRFMEHAILSRLGASYQAVLEGPKFGVDNAIIRVASGKVAVCTTDPISIIPALGIEKSAWLSVHLLASDITTSGFSPAFAIFDLNLPPKMEDADLERYWNAIHRSCTDLGVSIIGGHTGRFVGCDYTVVGGGFMIALGPEDRYLTSSMSQTGDVIVITKGAAIATTGILAHAFPNIIARKLGNQFVERAQAFFNDFSTVNDALTAISIGVRNEGVNAMHDVTEGGILGGIFELISSSKKGARIYKKSIYVGEEAMRICSLFGVDPFNALGEGSLVISVRREKTSELQSVLGRSGISSYIVGEVVPPQYGIQVIDESGKRALEYPEKDTYWDGYWRAVENGWN